MPRFRLIHDYNARDVCVEDLATQTLAGFVSWAWVEPWDLDPACQDDVRIVIRQLTAAGWTAVEPFIRVEEASVLDRFRRRKIGRAMYEALLRDVGHDSGNYVHLMVADRCAGGQTSTSAHRVWRSLQRDFIGHGLVVAPVPRRNDLKAALAHRRDERRRRNPAYRVNRSAPTSVARMLADAPSSWKRMFRKHGLSSAPSASEVLSLLEKTPSGRSAGSKGSKSHSVPDSVKRAALKGLRLSWENNYTSSSGIGLARAVQLATRSKVDDRTVKRMKAYFSRHTSDKSASNFGNDENPSRGYMAWLNWGGDAGQKWANRRA